MELRLAGGTNGCDEMGEGESFSSPFGREGGSEGGRSNETPVRREKGELFVRTLPLRRRGGGA